jgi:hypothetical protein
MGVGRGEVRLNADELEQHDCNEIPKMKIRVHQSKKENKCKEIKAHGGIGSPVADFPRKGGAAALGGLTAGKK